MTRTTLSVDRIATVVVALLLAVVGLLALEWRFGWLLDLDSSAPISTTGAVDLGTRSWWPWALGAAGVLLVLVGLRWLWAHLLSSRVAQLNLAGTGSDGRLRVNAKSAASTAADVLADNPGVRSARGTLTRDRGQLVVDLRASLTPDADLQDLARVCDTVAADLAHVLERSDLYCRVHLSVTGSGSATSRVQ
ncbi:MAG: alkaline shock response membrane anchor protein AmaP [Actinomycetota bacterium]|nr:alkaline shock response membrane anchor protein AmaP [Actinomycetota bacterium]